MAAVNGIAKLIMIGNEPFIAIRSGRREQTLPPAEALAVARENVRVATSAVEAAERAVPEVSAALGPAPPADVPERAPRDAVPLVTDQAKDLRLLVIRAEAELSHVRGLLDRHWAAVILAADNDRLHRAVARFDRILMEVAK